MGLINCHECTGKVSDTAASCPHCGAPLAQTSKVVRTIEETSKPLKLQKALSGFMLGSGLIWMFATSGNEVFSPWPFLFTLIALVWVVVTSVRIWWRHG